MAGPQRSRADEPVGAYLERFGLVYAAFDLGLDRQGARSWYEANANGQWAFYDDPINEQIARAGRCTGAREHEPVSTTHHLDAAAAPRTRRPRRAAQPGVAGRGRDCAAGSVPRRSGLPARRCNRPDPVAAAHPRHHARSPMACAGLPQRNPRHPARPPTHLPALVMRRARSTCGTTSNRRSPTGVRLGHHHWTSSGSRSRRDGRRCGVRTRPVRCRGRCPQTGSHELREVPRAGWWRR